MNTNSGLGVDLLNRRKIYFFSVGYRISNVTSHKPVASLDFGLAGLNAKPRSGRPPKLTQNQLAQVKSYVVDNAIKPQGGRLQGKDIQDYIEATFGVTYQKTNVYHLLHKLNLSWITTRSKHPKQSIEAQES